jgi:hypothetical protein
MRHNPASGAIVIMLKSLKMHGMAQAVGELTEQGSPAFEAAIPILSQLLKAETAEREVRSTAYQLKTARFPAYRDLNGFDFASSEVNEALVRQLHRCEFLERPTTSSWSAAPAQARPISPPPSACRPSSIITSGSGSSRPSSWSMRSNRRRPRGAQGRSPAARPLRSRHPRRARLPAVQCLRRSIALPSAEPALRAHQRRHHHQPQLQRMGQRLRRCQDDHRAARSPDPSLPHPRNRKRQLPLQEQLSSPPQNQKEKARTLTIKPDPKHT